MAYDEVLAQRVRDQVSERAEPEEIKMFGGLAFMVNTHMACGIIGNDLMVRVGPDGHDAAIKRGAREMDFTGRPMRAMVVVDGSDLKSDKNLQSWVNTGIEFVTSQPPKKRKQPKSG
jgi:TfoX/Sxy family transcriptional regulator of competence genes